jgi:hypothetical protein
MSALLSRPENWNVPILSDKFRKSLEWIAIKNAQFARKDCLQILAARCAQAGFVRR